MIPFNGLVYESRDNNYTSFVVHVTADQLMSMELLEIKTLLIEQVHYGVIVLFFFLQAMEGKGEELSFKVVDQFFVESLVKCGVMLAHLIMGYRLRVSASRFEPGGSTQSRFEVFH